MKELLLEGAKGGHRHSMAVAPYRGLIPHSFLQLVQDFGYWPLNRWLLYGGLTIKLKEIWRS